MSRHDQLSIVGLAEAHTLETAQLTMLRALGTPMLRSAIATTGGAITIGGAWS